LFVKIQLNASLSIYQIAKNTNDIIAFSISQHSESLPALDKSSVRDQVARLKADFEALRK